MRRDVTLNEVIANLSELAKNNGDAEVVSFGCCIGYFHSLQSPFLVSIRRQDGTRIDLYFASTVEEGKR